MPNAAIFLDYPSFQKSLPITPAIIIPIGPELREYVFGDSQLQDCISCYLDNFDPWMAFIPREVFRIQTSNPASQSSGEDILLLACIKNLTRPVLEDSPLTKQYLAIKSAFLGAEVAGAITERLLQALILLLLYEFGHGIYPCAYTTLGTCTRYLVVLGVDGACTSYSRPVSWIEVETRRRLWWAVFVLERAIALGCPQRPLSIEEPDESKLLPSDDISWEQGHPSPQSHFTLRTPPTSKMGRFRLLVHASYLLSQVLHYKSDDAGRDDERDTQLYCTIRALINVLELEGQYGVMTMTVPRSLLNSAIFVLYPATDPVEFENLQVQQSPCYISATYFLERCRKFLHSSKGSAEAASPLILHWGFQIFRYYYNLYQQDGRRETQIALEDITRSLRAMEERWKLAGVYMAILNLGQTATVA